MSSQNATTSSSANGRRQVFGGLSLAIRPGITGLLGPNGAGKSTLFSLLSTQRKPSSGTINVLGQDCTTMAGREAVRSKIGVLAQRYPLVGSMTVLDTVAYAGWAQGLTAKSAYPAAERILDKLDLAELTDRRVRTLSGGQRQRVGLASTLVHEPELLILDEPSAGLDPEVRMGLRRTLLGVAARATILLSTHLVDDVLAVCNHILVIDKGKVIFEGKPDELASYAVEGDHAGPGTPLEQGYESLLVQRRRECVN
ncbi:MAG: ATP-binding cassette domain-containing protein [Tetrasphaera sp.]